MAHRLLVIDDDHSNCKVLKAIFARVGIAVDIAYEGREGIELALGRLPDLVILDLHLPTIDGLEVLAELKRFDPALPVIMMTAHNDVKTALRATQLGAADYLVKPFDPDEIVVVVRRALETRALQAEVEDLRRQVGEGGGLSAKMGSSPAVLQIIDQVRVVAGSSFSVLILGETGTGKEIVAQAVHRQSERRGRPFIALDCGAIPETLLESELFGYEKGAFTGAERRREGHFQLAQGGTLFLDEIGNLPMGLQAKLLRVLESREIQSVGATKATPLDVRFVAATNHDLQRRVQDGLFRADLYFRLAQYTIGLPPLRERTSDIAHLAQRFLEEASVELRRPVRTVPAEVVTLLEKYAWPGNVRELRNVIRQAVLESKDLVIHRPLVQRLLGRNTGPSAIAPSTARGGSLREIAANAAREAERQAITEVLHSTRGNKSRAARVLDTDYKTLHLKMKILGIRARDFTS